MQNIVVELPAGLVVLVGIVLASVLVAKLPLSHSPDQPGPVLQLQNRMGLGGLNSGLFLAPLLFWVVIVLTLIFGLLTQILEIIIRPFPAAGDQKDAVGFLQLIMQSLGVTEITAQAEVWNWRFSLAKLTALTAVLGVVIALPFTLIRLTLTRAQVDVAEQGQITDRMNTAVQGLGAEKTVKRQRLRDSGARAYVNVGSKLDYSQPIMEEISEPNLEVRIGAIYALERIAQDSDRDHVQIMEILCTYIRQNAPSDLATPFPEKWKGAVEPVRDGVDVKRPDMNGIEEWVTDLKTPRVDIQVALTVIGRRSARQIALEGDKDTTGNWQGYKLDLRGTCLQRADLTKAHLDNAKLDMAQLQGATLEGTQLQGANLGRAQLQRAKLAGAQLQGAKLSRVQLQTADLLRAHLQGAQLGGAQLQGAHLAEAQLQEAFLVGAQLQEANFVGSQLQGAQLGGTQLQRAHLAEAQLQGANLGRAQLQRAKLAGAQLQGAHLSKAKLQGANLIRAQLQGADLFKAQLQMADLTSARMQGADLLKAQLQGANLKRAQLQGANLSMAALDSETNLTGAALKGAAMQHVDLTDTPQIAKQLEGMFGDATVKLPPSVTVPGHWATKKLDGEDFETAWRAFQRSIGQDPDNPE